MNRLGNWIEHLFAHQRWTIHAIFWLMVLVLYSVFFGLQNNTYLQTFFFVGLLMPITIGTTYFLNYFLIPRYLMKERYGYFLLYFSYTLLASLYLEMVVAMATFIIMAKLQISNMSPDSINVFFLLASLLMVVFLAVSIKMLLHWRKSREDYQKLMLEKVQAELKFLKIQLNPHFLFNTLNNLYYLASEKSEETPRAILALSELLDYVLQKSKTDFVSLEEELKQIHNFIALESLRYEDRLTIKFEIEGTPSEAKITPMLLITLVENAFKHGVMNVAADAWMVIQIKSDKQKIDIAIHNSTRKTRAENKSGIGLINLKSQLDHLYKNRHVLNIQQDDHSFGVNIVLHEV
ncbi:MAG: histidine kinase [Cyclobacteriaceae bacterium]|nr:histidine kinase [Cyclobacteriaceae bacterium]